MNLKWLPVVVSAVLILAAGFSPQVQALIAAHPALIIVLTQLDKLLHFALPSPVAQSEKVSQ